MKAPSSNPVIINVKDIKRTSELVNAAELKNSSKEHLAAEIRPDNTRRNAMSFISTAPMFY